MSLRNFLNAILPQEGYKCWVEISKDKKATQGLVPTIEELAAKLEEIDARGVDAYFACASYKTPQNRRAANALGAKAFWADIDCGKGKPYETQADAISSCDRFCADVHLPLPGIIRSGGGIHVYWPLRQVIEPGSWKAAASNLKILAGRQGFHIDPSRTADIASILRPPETHNYKIPNHARKVEIDDFELFEEINADDFIRNINNPSCVIDHPKLVDNSSLTAGIRGSRAFDPTVGIAEGSSEYGGRNNACAKYAGELLAKGHLESDVLAACAQWNQLNKPPLDDQELRTCVASIARRHRENNPAPPPPVEEQKLPDLPKGYRWSGSGQLLADIKDEETGKWEPQIVCQLPVYMKGWLKEEAAKPINSYLFEHYHPLEGYRQFAVSCEDLNGQSWYPSFSRNGVSVMKGMDKIFRNYIRDFENMFRLPGKEIHRYSQFGWKEEDKSILIGNTLCHADGRTEKVVGTDKLSPLMSVMQPAKRGSLEAWSRAANKLGTPTMEPHLFMLMTAFAAPLMKFCVDQGNGGSILSVISEESGQGKTPMATAIASVMGELASTVVTGNFTENRRIEDLVRHCHYVQVQEEMAYSDPMLATIGVEKFTSGTDRGRLSQSGNASGLPERYQTILVSISNKSLHDLVKMVNVPMSRRVFEIEIDRPDEQAIADIGGVVRDMMANCGHAGQQYVRFIVEAQTHQYLVENLRGADGKVGRTIRKYWDLLNTKPEDRFIVWLLATVELAARMVNHFGIMTFDVERLMEWAVSQARPRIQGAAPMIGLDTQKLDMFLTEFASDCCLTVPRAYLKTGSPLPVLKEPKRYLHMRYEVAGQKLFINHEALHRWCTKNNVSFNKWGQRLVELGVVLQRSKKVSLGAGTDLPSGQCLCWEVDMAHPEINGQLRAVMRDDEPKVVRA